MHNGPTETATYMLLHVPLQDRPIVVYISHEMVYNSSKIKRPSNIIARRGYDLIKSSLLPYKAILNVYKDELFIDKFNLLELL